ncbi:MAG: hypothetical protein WBI44_08075 [Syntrophaceticus sp.]
MMVESKKNTKMIWQGISLLGMLLAPALLLYPGAKNNSSGVIVLGYIILVLCMLIPLFLKK